MIQRQQTLWLLLATLAALLSFMFPFATGKVIENGAETDKFIYAGSHFLLLILTGATLVLSSVCIFLYKNRKQQQQLCLLGIILSLGILVLYFLEMNKLIKATPALFSILPFIVLFSYIMAWRNIRKDEKLIKSLDKLR